MAKEKKDFKMVSMTFYTSKHFYEKLREYSFSVEMPTSRIIASLIDNAIMRKVPFEYDLTLPSKDDILEHAYAEEGSILLNYFKSLNVGMGLDQLVMLRHDVGIPDKEILLTVFRECLDNNLIEGFTPPKKPGRAPFPEGYKYYRSVQRKARKSKVRRRNNDDDFAQYLKLKRKFSKEE